MTAYDNDVRVTARGGQSALYAVDLGGGRSGMVWLEAGGTWVATREHGSYQPHRTADEAIASLIGAPQ